MKPSESPTPSTQFPPGPDSKQWLGRVEFSSTRPSDAADHVIAMAAERQTRHIHLANAYSIALADKSASFRGALAEPALNFPDGKPLEWLSAIKRQKPHLHQVRGPELFLNVFDRGRTQNIRHYLLGATPRTLELLVTSLGKSFPGVEIVGSESPPFRVLRPEELQAQDARIHDSGAQIVWIGLGTPKQDFEAARLAESIPIIAIAVGAAFDFAAGTSKQAPSWMTGAGLEWVFRFASEPRRLWRRYVFGNLRFIKACLLTRRQT